jgi:hypothetical protein
MLQIDNNKAEIKLHPGRFTIVGPEELVLMIDVIVHNSSLNDNERKFQIDNILNKWYVICSVTGKKIYLDCLRYWDIELNEIYINPNVVPSLYKHLDKDYRPELKEYWIKKDKTRTCLSS